METVIGIVHRWETLVAALLTIVETIRRLIIGMKKIRKELEKGGKYKMTKKFKTGLFTNIVVTFIAITIFGVRGFTEPISIDTPFDMTSFYHPSGWMGDGEKGLKHIQLNPGFLECNRSGDKDGFCIQIRYQPDPNGKGWAGIYWQSPDGNWGDQPGREIKNATKITFWVKGEAGDEIVEFKAGGINTPGKPFQDSFEVAKRIRLNRNWKQYEIPLNNQDTTNVIGAFAWIASRAANPDGLTIYIDNIRYE